MNFFKHIIKFILSIAILSTHFAHATDYLIYKDNKGNFEIPTEAEHEAAYKIIMTYSFPMCLSQENEQVIKSLSPTDRENLFKNEEAFIQQKIEQVNPSLKVAFIPTTLYELFVLHFLYTSYSQLSKETTLKYLSKYPHTLFCGFSGSSGAKQFFSGSSSQKIETVKTLKLTRDIRLLHNYYMEIEFKKKLDQLLHYSFNSDIINYSTDHGIPVTSSTASSSSSSSSTTTINPNSNILCKHKFEELTSSSDTTIPTFASKKSLISIACAITQPNSAVWEELADKIFDLATTTIEGFRAKCTLSQNQMISQTKGMLKEVKLEKLVIKKTIKADCEAKEKGMFTLYRGTNGYYDTLDGIIKDENYPNLFHYSGLSFGLSLFAYVFTTIGNCVLNYYNQKFLYALLIKKSDYYDTTSTLRHLLKINPCTTLEGLVHNGGSQFHPRFIERFSSSDEEAFFQKLLRENARILKGDFVFKDKK